MTASGEMGSTARRREPAPAPVPRPAIEEPPLPPWTMCVDSDESALARHERCVAYVHALTPDPEPRSGVWMEHSYAAAKAVAVASGSAGSTARGAGAVHVRTLLGPRAPSPLSSDDADIDVEELGPAPPEPLEPPALDHWPSADDEDFSDSEIEKWEARVEALGGGGVLREIREFRLSRLAGGESGRESAIGAARRVRRQLATRWASASALHALLLAGPAIERALWAELVAELRRMVPRLAARLGAGPVAPAPPPPPPAVMPMSSRPLLLWLGGGCERYDARWERPLRALVPTHYVRLPNTEACSPERWCGAALGAARAALAAASREPCSLLALGGAGAGASLALALCSAGADAAGTAAAPGALLLLGPPLLTAEGPRTPPTMPPLKVGVPLLAVVGGSASRGWRTLLCESGLGARGSCRVVVAAGADDALRLPRRRRRQLRLPQYALDAALLEECARWLHDVAEGGGSSPHAEEVTAPAPPPPRLRRERPRSGDTNSEEYAHLPAAASAAATASSSASTSGHTRSIEIIEGRVVSRVCGGTPLQLERPRRHAPSSAPATGSAVPADALDILNMPVVFTDVPQVTSTTARGSRGAGRPTARVSYSKVIVAKRAPGSTGGPIVLRGGVRVLPPRALPKRTRTEH